MKLFQLYKKSNNNLLVWMESASNRDTPCYFKFNHRKVNWFAGDILVPLL